MHITVWPETTVKLEECVIGDAHTPRTALSGNMS
jgi:hypothetical protein